jgi:hypothetical protein
MFRVTGFKNKKREETIQLIVCRIQSEAVAKMLYPEDDSDISRQQQPPAPTGNAQVTVIEQQQCFHCQAALQVIALNILEDRQQKIHHLQLNPCHEQLHLEQQQAARLAVGR